MQHWSWVFFLSVSSSDKNSSLPLLLNRPMLVLVLPMSMAKIMAAFPLLITLPVA